MSAETLPATKPAPPATLTPTTTTTRAQFGAALCAAMAAPVDAVRITVVVAWCMIEGQEARENDPLARWNAVYAHPPGQDSNKFSYDTIDHAIVDCANSMRSGAVYGSIGDAFRDAKATAPSIIDAIQRAGWCGGPHAPCPAYGAGIRSNYARISKTTAAFQAEASKPCATTTTSADLTKFGLGPGGVINPIAPGVPIDALLGIGNPISSVDDAIKALGTFSQILSKLVGNLTTVGFWKRVGIFVLGAWLILAALYVIFKDSEPVAAIAKTAKVAATAAVAA